MTSISNLLIIISIFFTLNAFIFPDLYSLGMNNFFLNNGVYYVYILQFFTSQFLHGGFFHLLMNSIFIYYFGNTLESLIGKKNFIVFFIFSTIFVGIMLSLFSNGNTFGISSFAMAILTYYTLELKSRNNLEYKGGISAIILNIGIGFLPGISLVGHLFGAIAGVLYYFFGKDFFKKNIYFG